MAAAVLLILAIFGLCISAAQPRGSAPDVASSVILQAPDFDLDGAFVRGALPDNLKQSLSLIEKTETLPSCGKVATSALLHSCSALEGSIDHDSQLPPGSDLLIEEESDIYAARLAVCELSGADFSVPAECRSFIPTSGGRKKTTILRGWLSSPPASKPRIANEYYDKVTEANIKQCRRALGSSGQAWTSYSNSRQNAVAMCHAMQSAVERDESRHVAKILATTAAATSGSLQEAYEHINDIKQLFHELRTAMPEFQKDLATFDGGIQQRVQEFWNQLDQARSRLESLTALADQAQGGMKEARDYLNDILSSHMPQLGRAIAKAGQEVRDASDGATAAAELVAYRVQLIQQDLITGLNNAGYGLAAINDLMPHFNEVVQNTINNTLQFYEAATSKQLELNAAQDDMVGGLQRMNQTTADANANAERLKAELGEWADYAVKAGQWRVFLATCVMIVALSAAFGFLSLPLWHDCIGCSFVSSHYAAVGSAIAFGLALNLFWQPIASFAQALIDRVLQSQSAISWSLLATLASSICALVLLVTVTGRCVCVSRPPCLPTDEYDPFSPPVGIHASTIRLRERMKPSEMFSYDRPTRATKCRV